MIGISAKFVPFARLGIAWAGLLFWASSYQALPCFAVLIFVLPVTLAILLGMLESAFLQRRAVAKMYLRHDRVLYRLLRGGKILMSWQTVKAIFFAMLLLMAATQWETAHWILLGFDALAIGFVFALFQGWLSWQVKPGFDALFARHLLVYLNTLVFVIILALVDFNLPHPDYRQVTFATAIFNEVGAVEADCDAVGILARGGVAAQTTGWWLAETWLTRPEIAPLAGLGWLLFLMGSAAFMWAYSRFLLGALISSAELTYLLSLVAGAEDIPNPPEKKPDD